MGEVPVLVDGARRLTQSGVILTYLADKTGKFRPQSKDDRLEVLRWIIFDNQKLNGHLGPSRFLKTLARPAGDPVVLNFLKARIDNALGILDKRLAGRSWVVGDAPSTADISLCGYLYYPAAEFGFDIAATYLSIARRLDRIKAARLGAPLRPHAGPPAAGAVRSVTFGAPRNCRTPASPASSACG